MSERSNAIAPEKPAIAATESQSTEELSTEEESAEVSDSPVPRSKSYMRVKIGGLEFSSLEGDILGEPYIRLRTHQYSDAKFVLNDPDDSLRLEILDQQDVEIEIGWVGAEKQNVFVGKIYSVSRLPPDGTEVEAVDPSAQMQGANNSVAFQSEKPLPSADEQGDQEGQGSEDGLSEEEESGSDEAASDQEGGLTDTPQADDGWGAMRQLLTQVGDAVRRDRIAVAKADQATNNYPGLKFADDRAIASYRQGSVQTQQGDLEAAQKEAKSMGDLVVARGNTVRQVAPGAGQSSGVILDYSENRPVFIGRPKVTKRTGLQLAGPVGALRVAGWSPNSKTVVSATVVTPGATPGHPTGNIAVPDWGTLSLSEPIFPGCIYTWNDATKNGTRVPTREIMERIIVIAQVIQPLTDQTVGQGQRWTITSWYRDPASNNRAGGAPGSRHLSGDAVDFYFPGMDALYKSLYDSYEGGLAQKPGSFTHMDARGSRSRWTY